MDGKVSHIHLTKTIQRKKVTHTINRWVYTSDFNDYVSITKCEFAKIETSATYLQVFQFDYNRVSAKHATVEPVNKNCEIDLS